MHICDDYGVLLASRDSMNTKGLMRVVKDVKFYAFTTWLLVVAFGFVKFSITGGDFLYCQLSIANTGL